MLLIYSSIDLAALLPAPMARMTVAAPVAAVVPVQVSAAMAAAVVQAVLVA